MRKALVILLSASMLLSGCKSMSNLAEGLLIGGGAGAAVGAGAGALIGGDAKSAAIGAAVGTAVGTTVGALIGKKMDKKAEELAALEEAKIDTLTDVNGLKAIKVTFNSGILFKTNSANLSKESQTDLAEFAKIMSDLPDTDITIFGHTDNTGTAAVNEKLSAQRATSVADYLKTCGIAEGRMTTEGKSFNEPVASNDTAEGRQQNRRVEIYISANEQMIKNAEAGKLN
ncbi:MAG: OmpA family protein [Bacteroidaceae bacterium]|nr:OmpA family protein [Bacteroidaceae bacterium]